MTERRAEKDVMSERPVYLDYHATTPVDPRVREAMWPYFGDRFGNAASTHHAIGREASEAVERARTELAQLIGATSREIVFTSGATESNNLALKGVLRAERGRPGHVVVAAAEHRAILDPARALAREGFGVTVVPVEIDGTVSPDRIAEAIRPETRLVSVMWVNNEVGCINPIEAIAELCRARGVRFHSDAAQAIGRVPVDVASAGVDLLSGTAHKIYGPQGVGWLYVKRSDDRRVRLDPLQHGGGHEQHLRSGTLPLALIVGAGVAARHCFAEGEADQRRLRPLRDELWQRLTARVAGLRLNGPALDDPRRVGSNLNFSVEGVDGEALLMSLTRLAVSSGAACSSVDREPSHVLRAMGLPDPLARASLRLGLGRFTTPDDCALAVEHLAETITQLRRS